MSARGSMATLREGIADLSARPADSEARADALPYRRKYLLVTAFLRRLLDLHLELVEEVERELDAEPGGPAT